MNEKSTPEYWDDRVKNAENERMMIWAAQPEIFDSAQDTIERVLVALAEPGMKVLDAGCGYGRFYPIIFQAGADYEGIDFSEEMILLAKRKHPKGNFTAVNFMDHRPETLFDVVFSVYCTSSVGSGLKDRLLKFIKRDGLLVIAEDSEITIYFNHA